MEVKLLILIKFEEKILKIFIALIQAIRKRYQNVSLQYMDKVILSYIALIGILVFPFHRNVSNWVMYPFLHGAIFFFLLEWIRISNNASSFIQFLRTFYPILWILLAWKEMDQLVTMIFPYWFNPILPKLDYILFGVYPTVWVQKWFSPWLTELMNFFYGIYFLFIPLVAIVLYAKGQRQKVYHFLFLISSTFAFSFIIFLLCPAQGAWVYIREQHTMEPKGGFFLALIRLIQHGGTIQGGAFPSSHVAAAWVSTLSAWRYLRPVGYVLSPLALGVTLATVYCRYHYAVDAIAGIVLGTIVYIAGIRFLVRRGLE